MSDRLPSLSRRELLRTVGGLSAASVFGSSRASGQMTSGESWPQFGYDSSNSGYAPNTGVVDDVEQRWTYETEGPIIGSPAVVDGTVYVGSDDGNLYALSTEDGTEQWRFETASVILRSSPLVHNGKVYVGSQNGTVYALSATDGSEQWAFETESTIERSSPTLVDGSVYIGDIDGNVYALSGRDGDGLYHNQVRGQIRTSPAVDDNGTVYVGTEYGQLHAVDMQNSVEEWQASLGDSVNSSPTVVDGTVYVGSQGRFGTATPMPISAEPETNGGTVYAFSAEDGSRQWSFDTGGPVQGSPAVAEDTVYVGSDDNTVYALSAADGTERWQYRTEGEVSAAPAVAGGIVHVGCEDGRVYGLSAADGSERWQFLVDDAVHSAAAVVGGTVYVGTVAGTVYALTGKPSNSLLGTETAQTSSSAWRQLGGGPTNTKISTASNLPISGVKEQWRSKIGPKSSTAFAPAVVDDTVYAGMSNSQFYALSTSDGSVRWLFYPDGDLHSSPAVVDGVVYVGTADGTIHARSTTDGNELWQTRTDGPVYSPTVVDDTVYVRTGSDVRALSVTDGSEQWRFQAREAGPQGNYSSPAVLNNTVYVENGDGISAVSRSSGSERWFFRTDSSVSTPAVADETVYFGCADGTVYALASSGGSERWQFDTEQSGYSWAYSPAVTRETVYVGTADGVCAIEAADGTERWCSKRRHSGSAPVVGADTVYVAGGLNNDVYALSTTDGVERWRFQTKSSTYAAPAVSNGSVYIVSEDGHVYALSNGPKEVGSAGVVLPGKAVFPGTEYGPTSFHLWEWQAALAGAGSLVGGTALTKGVQRVRRRRSRLRPDTTNTVDAAAMDDREESTSSETSNEADTDPSSTEDTTATESAAAETNDPRERTEDADRTPNDERLSGDETGSSQDAETPDALREFLDACPAAVSGPGRIMADDGPLHWYAASLTDGKDAVFFTVVAPEYADNESLAGEFEYVVRKWRRISRHDGVVDVLDYGAEPRPWVGTQPTSQTLASTLSDADLDLDERLSMLHTVSNAVRAANRSNVAHPSLSPQCIHCDGTDATVSDWGLRAAVDDELDREPAVTPYTAPEQLPDGEGVLQSTTTYRLAAVAYTLVTGQPPYTETESLQSAIRNTEFRPPSEVADVPPGVDTIFEDALSPRPDERPGVNFVYRLLAQFE